MNSNLPAKKVLTDKILSFIFANFLKSGGDLTVNTPLMDLNILDSTSVFDIVDFISSEFNIRIPLADIHPGNFHSVAHLETLIVRLAGTAAASAPAGPSHLPH